jgi:hypothetical protein
MIRMKRTLLLGAAASALTVASAPAASAAIVELGAVPSAPLTAPVCPPGKASNCKIVLNQVTAVQTVRNGVGYPTKVQQAGMIVAFKVGLSQLSSNRNTAHTYIHDLDQSFGTTRVAITVLAPSGPGRLHRFKDVAQSPFYHVQPYLGQVVQIPLQTALPVFRGDVIALTTSTWAPVLTILLPSKSYFYRQSRQTGCNSKHPRVEPQAVGDTSTYSCHYTGTRVEYSATEVTNPVAINPIRSVFRGVSASRQYQFGTSPLQPTGGVGV